VSASSSSKVVEVAFGIIIAIVRPTPTTIGASARSPDAVPP
jgi:hypothetical protein